MKIIFTNGNSAHVEKSVGDALIAGGMAVLAPPEPGEPKPAAPQACTLIWTVTIMPKSEFPCVTAVCRHCRQTHSYIVDYREPWRKREFQNRWTGGAYVKEYGGVENFVVWHAGARVGIPPAILEKVRALGIPNPETAYQGTPPLEFLQMSGDPIRDQMTIDSAKEVPGHGKRPSDPRPGPVIQYMNEGNAVKEA